ncbi:sigma 54-interacting transcriptional regulator [Anaeromicrobium sediminis]|uniref:Sigma-54-dependent Fis family transcriptional regulator n=1 Tax=Anaeromicrobium sediminis TaxID=1478221 RepID=A0A267MG05_9FIRM|nr:sigma 54-interacting transcriptional regulator [Anaeromicrobium sediminis]PAB57730.1 hypothetical protein CCE28_18065 [Anaeromicrobium sediminis]
MNDGSGKVDIPSELFRCIFNNSNDGIIIIDTLYKIHDINPKAEEILGLEKSNIQYESLKKSVPNLFHKGELKKGEINLDNGKSIEMCVKNIGFGIYEKAIFLKEICEIHIEFEAIKKGINSIDEGIMLCNEDGNVTFYNEAYAEIESLVREDVIGKNVTNVYDLTEEDSLMLKSIKTKKPILNRYLNYTTYMGKNLNIICNTYPIKEDGQALGAICVTREYSKVKTLSEKIIEWQKKLYDKKGKNESVVESATYTFEDIIGIEKILKNNLDWTKKVSKSDHPVLIYGETGTGKELMAQSIHNASKRREGPFIPINCAAIPENLLEGILFGTVKGAFTEATDRQGLFEQANGGTLLLDELNSMPLGLQAKLLRVIQEKKVRRVGANKEIPIDVRIITNINVEPSIAVKRKLIREDLFYRLGVVYIKIPPLRERKEDILLLTDSFLKENENVKLSKAVIDMFMEYDWPGNIRELKHVLESALIMLKEDENVIKIHHLPIHIKERIGHEIEDSTENSTMDEEEKPLVETMENVEKETIVATLKKNNWNVSKSSRELGLRRQSLQYRMKKYNIWKMK